MRSPGSIIARVSRWTPEHTFTVDVAFALAVGAISLAGHLAAEVTGSERAASPLSILLIATGAAIFAFRRRAPLPSVVGVALVTAVFWVADYAADVNMLSILSVYAAVAHGGGQRRRVWTVTGGAVVFMSAITVLGVLSPSEDLPAIVVVGVTIVHLTAAITGELVFDRHRRIALLEERAERAEAERELLAREAVLAERSRIARDLHDIVAHAMSIMVVQAGAAERVVAHRPERATQALADIQATGREALSDMRRIVGVLRDGDDPELVPQPTIDDLDTVVRHCSDAGVPTELIVEGAPAQRMPGIEMTGFRVVQEALTNVVKHAGRPASASVRVTHRPGEMRVEVVDDGRGATSDEVAAATGHGLVGMRERVETYRGAFHAGPRPGGGFRVAAVLPVDTDPTAGHPGPADPPSRAGTGAAPGVVPGVAPGVVPGVVPDEWLGAT